MVNEAGANLQAEQRSKNGWQSRADNLRRLRNYIAGSSSLSELLTEGANCKESPSKS